MNTTAAKTCTMCRGLTRRPMFIVSTMKNSPTADLDNKHLIAALLKCSCHNDMRAEYGTNAADLNDLHPIIRQAIYDRLNTNKNCIPVIDPETINSHGRLTFITNLNRRRINTWTAMDLLSLRQLYELDEQKIITLEEIDTRLAVTP